MSFWIILPPDNISDLDHRDPVFRMVVSDLRPKHNIHPITAGLDQVLKLNPGEWLWNETNEFGQGLVAQEW